MKIINLRKEPTIVKKFIHGTVYRKNSTSHGDNAYLCIRHGADTGGRNVVQLVNVRSGNTWSARGVRADNTDGWLELDCELHVLGEVTQ